MSKLMSSVLVLLGLMVGMALAGDQDFTLVNRTGVDIEEVYVSAASVDEWEEDVLGENILEDGASAHIRFSSEESAELWDIKVVDGEGTEVIWNQIKLTAVSIVTLTIVDGEPIAELE